MLKHRAMDTPIESRHTGKMVQTEKTFAESTLISISYSTVVEEWRDIKINIYVNPFISFSHLCNSSRYAATVTRRAAWCMQTILEYFKQKVLWIKKKKSLLFW